MSAVGPGRLLVLGVALAAAPGCASRRLLRVENRVLAAENDDLQRRLADCRDRGSDDFAVDVDSDVVRVYLQRSGLEVRESETPGVFLAPIEGDEASFNLAVQVFEREKVVYMAVTDYLDIDEAVSPGAMVLLLTRMATLNYELLLGKFQLEPRSGQVILSVELNFDDGLGYRTFDTVLRHLVQTADERYPELLRAAQGNAL